MFRLLWRLADAHRSGQTLAGSGGAQPEVAAAVGRTHQPPGQQGEGGGINLGFMGYVLGGFKGTFEGV